METFSLEEVNTAVKDAIHLGALRFDAVKHLVLCRLEGRPPPAGPGVLSPSAPGAGEHDIRRGLHDIAVGEDGMNDRSTLLLEHHLKELKLPSFLREYGKMAAQCAEGMDHPQYLLRLAELELIDCHYPMVERRIRAARFPAIQSLYTFDFTAIPSVNKGLVMELAHCEYIQGQENVIAKTLVALGLGLTSCQRGMSVGFTTAVVHLIAALDTTVAPPLLGVRRRSLPYFLSFASMRCARSMR